MRWLVGLAVLALGALVAPAWSGDIYTWTDSDGSVHYSNTPNAGSEHLAVKDDAPAAPATAPGASASAGDAPAGDEDADTFSTRASLQRTAIERSMRDTEGRIADVDARIAANARARGAHAGGSVATGGVAPDLEVQSEEDRTLEAQRKELADQLAGLQADYAKLKSAVVAKTGSTPPWWVEYRPTRR